MENCAEFEPFLPLQQSPVYAETLARLGARPRWIALDCGKALAVERGALRMVLRGPIFDPGSGARDHRRALRQLARWRGMTLVTPEAPVRGVGLIPLVTPLHHAILPLGPDLRRGLAGNWRNALVAGERAGVRVQKGNLLTLERLLAAEAEQRVARRYRALSPGFSRALPDRALRIWEWRQAGAMQAAMVFVRHGSSASYHLAWGSDRARAANAHRVMLMRAAEALAEEGVRWLDLGPVDSERALGLAQFKLGTGADLRRLGSTLLVLP